MEGGKLRGWEKAYWGVFVTAVAFLLFNRLKPAEGGGSQESLEAERAAKYAARLAQARLLLAGESLTSKDPVRAKDPFEGMEPIEVQHWCEEATGTDSTDPFEGMTPEEINKYHMPK